MGSSALYHLARRGLRVLGIERYNIPHEMGSSHGLTRIIRLAYYEHPSYVPLLRRAYELWRQLENTVQERLLIITGSIDASPEDGEVFTGSKASCDIHHLPHEVLDHRELKARFPGYHLPQGLMALYQPDGGFLLSERCIVAHVMAAQELGAEVHGQEHVVRWETKGQGVEVHTDRGSYSADKLVICAGAWGAKLVPELATLAVPERQVLGWFQPSTAGSVPCAYLPGVQHGGGGRPLLRVPDLWHPRLQGGTLPSSGAACGPRPDGSRHTP